MKCDIAVTKLNMEQNTEKKKSEEVRNKNASNIRRHNFCTS